MFPTSPAFLAANVTRPQRGFFKASSLERLRYPTPRLVWGYQALNRRYNKVSVFGEILLVSLCHIINQGFINLQIEGLVCILEIGKTFYAPIKCFECTKTGTETVQLRRWCVVRWSKRILAMTWLENKNKGNIEEGTRAKTLKIVWNHPPICSFFG